MGKEGMGKAQDIHEWGVEFDRDLWTLTQKLLREAERVDVGELQPFATSLQETIGRRVGERKRSCLLPVKDSNSTTPR